MSRSCQEAPDDAAPGTAEDADSVLVGAAAGAGTLVVNDVPPRAVMVGLPARQVREVSDDELI